MGIYLPNMEMPETCCDCRFAVDGWCYAAEKQDNKQYLNDIQRTNWCPLIPVPAHGDLIERDALLSEYPEPSNYLGTDGVIFHITGIRASIECAETIIPAESESE